MPFQSEKQRRYLWANEPEIARDWADTYGSRIEKNDGGIMRVGLQWGGPGGKSPGTSSSGGTHEGGYGRSDGPPGGGDQRMKHHQIKDYQQKKGDYIDRKIKKDFIDKSKKEKQKLSFTQKLKQIQINKNKVLAMRQLGLMENQKLGIWGGLYQGLTGQVPGWAEGMTEEELNAIARTGPYLGADDPRTAKELESGSELLGRVFKGGPFNTRNLDQGGDQTLPNYYAPRDVHPGTGGDTTTEPEYSFNTDFQDSLTSAATTPDYFVGETPLASNLEWGKKMGVDPRTMGLTSFAANGGRIPRAFGGIMDTATGRRGYFLGSIGDALGSVAKAAKKVFKSPVGKAAIMYGLGMIPFGGQSTWSRLGGMIPTGLKNKMFMKKLTERAVDKNTGVITPATYKGLDWGKAAIWGSSLLPWMLPGPKEDDEGDKGSNYDVLRDKYASQLMNIKSGLSAGSLNPNQWSYLPADYTYTGAEGGRAALSGGGDPMLVEEYQKYVFEMEEMGVTPMTFEEFKAQARAGMYAGGQSIPSEYTMEDAMMATTQDKMGGITEVMKQADLARQGSVGQMYAADGGRIGAEEGGLMDLGGMEKDYRAEGGFVPIGGEEKADDVPARLSRNEFVFTADAVRGAGGGDIDKGAEIMENIMNNLEQGGQISEETQGLTGAQEMFGVSERLSEVV